MRAKIREEVELIQPLDELERESKLDVLAWIDSGAKLCRLEKPATPPKHLVSYFAVVDDDHLLLVDHINTELWLPAGGHVDPGEHPRDTALREAEEELSIEGEFLKEGPVFLTVTETVGKTAGHTDVSLWRIVRIRVLISASQPAERAETEAETGPLRVDRDRHPTDVAVASVILGATGAMPRAYGYVDRNGDGILDLRLRYKLKDVPLACGELTLAVSATTSDGDTERGELRLEVTGCVF
jgi:8-oxo-dGTP pyrophosphatase MutT (NUDIX family)